MERMIYIPTHRPCIAVINEQLAEASWISQHTNDKATFCLIDNSQDSEDVALHADFLSRHKPSNVTVLHMTAGVQAKFVGEILASETVRALRIERLERLLLPEGLSYGRGPNIAALAAVSLRCETVHRRDSDELRDLDRPLDFPIEMELAAVGHTLAEIVDGPTVSPQSRIAMVGTSMFGSPTIDRRDLFLAGEIFALRFQQLGRPGADLADVKAEAESYLLAESRVKYAGDFFSDDGARVEMGFCCITRGLYTLLPEMPTGILGCDYMVKDLAWRLGIPVVFHSRKVNHVYTESREHRRNLAEYVDYAIRDIQYIQIGRIWQLHGERMLQDPEWFLNDGHFDSARYAESFRNAAYESSETLAEVRVRAHEIYRDAAISAAPGLSERLGAVADRISAFGSMMDRTVLEAVDDFAVLVESWRVLVQSAPEARNVLEDAIL